MERPWSHSLDPSRKFPTISVSDGPQRAAVRGILEETSRQVAHMADGAMRDLTPILVQAERELQRDIVKWLQKVDGAERFTTQQLRVALLQIQEALDRIAALQPDLLRSLQRGSGTAARLATHHLFDEVAHMSALFGEPQQIRLDITALMARGDRMLLPRFNKISKRYSEDVVQDIKRQLAIGKVKGESIYELTQRLQRLGGQKPLVGADPQGVAGRISGAFYLRHWHWADRIARTEIVNAYNVHGDNGIRQARKYIPDLVRRWDAATDSRTCALCRDLDGRVVPVGVPFDLDIVNAPAHPRCRCRVGAWRPGWEEFFE